MKIALVVHDLHNHGGHSAYAGILADAFARRHEVTVFANRCEQPSDARWQFRRVRAVRANAVMTVRSFPLGLRFRRRLLSKYDIRHAQGYCGGNPNVVTAHICVAAYLDSLRGVSWRHRVALQLMANAESRFYRRYQGRVIAVSSKTARELREFYHVAGSIDVIPHGVDAARFNGDCKDQRLTVRRQLGIEDHETMILYVGDLTKAHVYLKELARAAPWATLVIVTHSQAYRWKSGNVRILSSTRELAPYYGAADAFVFPTTYDAFGMVLLEAMASGLPVFSSDRAGAVELIQSGKNGFVFALDDWVAGTIAALRDLAALRDVGNEARKTARQHDWSKVVREVEQVYFRVAAGDVLAPEATVSAYSYQR
jgi:UDP-glucose:(heptosyl)LPS alpha-1,3-glucosyltransferase